MVHHAVFGTLKALDARRNTLVVTPIQGSEMTLRVQADLQVRNLDPQPTLAALAAKIGQQLIVQYTDAVRNAEAVEIDYVGPRQINATAGVVLRVDTRAKTIVVRTADGSEESFEAAPSTPTELASGVVPLERVAERENSHALLFYTTHGGKRQVRFIIGDCC